MPSPPPGDSSKNIAEELGLLASREMTAMETAPERSADAQFGYERHPIGPTLANRLRSLGREEVRSRQQRYITPSWSREGALPGLIVAQRYIGGDAYNASRQTAELDTALRRAAALLGLLEAGDEVNAWPRPIRPERGGLWLLDAQYGSLDLLWTFYGSLVAVATSTPISLASFASLAWSSGRSVRMAGRWIVRSLRHGELSDRPSAGNALEVTDGKGEVWHERTTKRLVPIFKEAIRDGRGLDFKATGPSGEVRLIVTPRQRRESTDDHQ